MQPILDLLALPVVQTTIWILVVTVSVILAVAFSVLFERKIIGWMQLRKGPNRVGSIFGFWPGVFQAFADVLKLLIKEVVVPAQANKVMFALAPIIALVPALATWAVVHQVQAAANPAPWVDRLVAELEDAVPGVRRQIAHVPDADPQVISTGLPLTP